MGRISLGWVPEQCIELTYLELWVGAFLGEGVEMLHVGEGAGGRGWQAEQINSHPVSTYIEMRSIHIEQSICVYIYCCQVAVCGIIFSPED